MKIGYFGDGPWAHKNIQKVLCDKKFKICFIVGRNNSIDSTLEQIANRNSIDFFSFKNINDTKSFNKLITYDCDIFVSMSYNQIFKSKIINYPKKGTINCHAGDLPRYRGRNILNWALINDEKEFGVTVHYIDEGIDTGDIILQQKESISDQDDYGTLLERSHSVCADLLYKALVLIESNQANKISQNNMNVEGFYCKGRKEGDEVINWNNSAREVFNLVRAVTSPGPLAKTTYNENVIKIRKAIMDSHTTVDGFKCGQIISDDNQSISIKCKDHSLTIKKNDIIMQNKYLTFKIGEFFK